MTTRSMRGHRTLGNQEYQRLCTWPWVPLAAVLLIAPQPLHGAGKRSGDYEQSQLAFNFTSSANQTAQLSVSAEGGKTITVSNQDESAAFTVSVTGRSDESEITLTVSESLDVDLTLSYESGESVSIALDAQPAGATVAVNIGADSARSVTVVDPSADRVGVQLTMTAVESASSVSISFDDLPEDGESGGRVTPLFPGLLHEEALGGSVTLAATGMSTDSHAVVTLQYAQADAAGRDETALRVHRFENTTGAFEPVGDNDRGIGAPSEQTGDFGVDMETNAAWCVVDQLGTFAVGETDDTLPAMVEDDDIGANGLSGGTGLCGAAGLVSPLFLTLGLLGLRRRGRRP